TTTNSNLSTTFFATNNTIYVDQNLPSLIEMIETNNYAVSTSYVYYSSQDSSSGLSINSPAGSLILKRSAPIGKITINEGYLGPLRVHEFLGMSSTVFNNTQGIGT